MNFLRRLALQEKNLDASSRLDVVEIARMGEERGRIEPWWGNRRERDHWGDLRVDGWIILGCISMRLDVGMWTGLGWPRIGTGGGRL